MLSAWTRDVQITCLLDYRISPVSIELPNVLLLAQRLAGCSIGLVAVFDIVQIVPGKARLILLYSTTPRDDVSAFGIDGRSPGSDLGAMLIPGCVQCSCNLRSPGKYNKQMLPKIVKCWQNAVVV
jgi:hypothetical protein